MATNFVISASIVTESYRNSPTTGMKKTTKMADKEILRKNYCANHSLARLLLNLHS
jgi:hypothetical protein